MLKRGKTVLFAFLAIAVLFTALGEVSWAGTIPMHRGRSVDGKYVFTTSEQTFGKALSGGYQEERACEDCESPLFYVWDENNKNTKPFYLMRQGLSGRFYYSSDETERKKLTAEGWEELQKDGYIYETKVEGTSEVFHLHNKNSGESIYTTSADEKNYYLNARTSDGWVKQPSLGYAQPLSSIGAAVLSPNTVKLDKETLSQLSRISNDGKKIVFHRATSVLESLSPGKILYSDKNHITPYGIVGKVLSVKRSSTQVTVLISPASLAEAFEEIHFFADNKATYFTAPKETKGAQAKKENPTVGIDVSNCRKSAGGGGGQWLQDNSAPLMEYLQYIKKTTQRVSEKKTTTQRVSDSDYGDYSVTAGAQCDWEATFKDFQWKGSKYIKPARYRLLQHL